MTQGSNRWRRTEEADTLSPRPCTPSSKTRMGRHTFWVSGRSPHPSRDDDQVLMRVVASSLNIYDWHMTSGTPHMVRAVAGLTGPKHAIPGADVAGVVERVGQNVSDFSVGDEVFGDIGHGAFAEYAVARPASIAPKPANVSFASSGCRTAGCADGPSRASRRRRNREPGRRCWSTGRLAESAPSQSRSPSPSEPT